MRIPVIPTILVAAAIATMIGLGVWQLQRMAWKEDLIAQMSAADAYRADSVECRVDAAPDIRIGRSAAGQTGYRYLVPCGALTLDLGWSQRPDALGVVRMEGQFSGQRATRGDAARILVLDQPIPPLAKSELPNPADLPNNHLAYAGQWFFFAAAAAIIYVLALRRRKLGS